MHHQHMALTWYLFHRYLGSNSLGCDCSLWYSLNATAAAIASGTCSTPSDASSVTLSASTSGMPDYFVNTNLTLFQCCKILHSLPDGVSLDLSLLTSDLCSWIQCDSFCPSNEWNSSDVDGSVWAVAWSQPSLRERNLVSFLLCSLALDLSHIMCCERIK